MHLITVIGAVFSTAIVVIGSVYLPASTTQFLGFGGLILAFLGKMYMDEKNQNAIKEKVSDVSAKQDDKAIEDEYRANQIKKDLARSNLAIQEQLEQKAAEVKETVKTTTADQNEKLATIHSLVNGGMAEKLKIIADDKKRISDLSSDPKDKIAAEEAQKILDIYLAQGPK